MTVSLRFPADEDYFLEVHFYHRRSLTDFVTDEESEFTSALAQATGVKTKLYR